ncbi:MAG TPA: hypothetical protein VD948_05680 [Rhodothermales bacterium]|nr:hypothetical protein [Rhodothermales bacterium]
MRFLNAFVLLGVSLLLGFTFYDNVPGKHGGAPSGRDMSMSAYEAAKAAVVSQVGSGPHTTFPQAPETRGHVSQQLDGTYLVRSWVERRSLVGFSSRTPWTAQVRCMADGCRVLTSGLARV